MHIRRFVETGLHVESSYDVDESSLDTLGDSGTLAQGLIRRYRTGVSPSHSVSSCNPRGIVMKGLASALLFGLATIIQTDALAQSYFTNCVANTGSDATIIIDAAGSHVLGTGTFQAGDEIGIFTEDGQCVGTDSWTGQNIAITVRGDDPLQPTKYGLLPEESFMVRLWDKSTNQLYGTNYGTVSFNMATYAPFLPSKTYVKNALYMTARIEAVGTTATGKNKVRTKGRKKKATERGVNNTAMFSISRTGPFNEPLVVDFGLGGSAVNGNDFAYISPSVTFGPGEKSVHVIIAPVDDGLVEGVETVTLTLYGSDGYDLSADYSFASVSIEDGGTSLGTESESQLRGFTLATPYPNPFTDRTAVKFQAQETQRIRVELYNVIGKRVASIFDGTIQAGIEYEFLIDAAGLTDGLYMINATGKNSTVRSVVLRR